MRSSFKLLAILPLLSAGVAQAAISNGGFENPNLPATSWQTYTSDSFDLDFGARGSIAAVPSSTVGAPSSAGDYVAFLHAGRTDDYQRLWQDFTTADAGMTLSMLLKWKGNDTIYYDAAYNDDGYARVAQLDGSGNPLSWTTLWVGSIAKYGNDADSAWETATATLGGAGSYRVEFGIRNVGIGAVGDDDDYASSELLVDNVALAAPVPEPGEWAMMAAGLGLVGFVGRRRMRSAA